MNIRDINGNINEDLTILVQHVKSYSITSSRRHIGTVQNMLKNKVKKQTKISYLGTGNCTRYVRNFSKKNFFNQIFRPNFFCLWILDAETSQSSV